MAAPLTTSRNKYHENPKSSNIQTPIPLARWVWRTVENSKEFRKLHAYDHITYDICAGEGNLSRFAPKPKILIEIEKPKEITGYHRIRDFLETTPAEFPISPSIVLCNPPFNWEPGHRQRELRPLVFLRHIQHVFGKKYPVVLFAPMGILFNQRMVSTRFREMRDTVGMNPTSIVSLPINVFEGVEFHSLILFFNMPSLQPHYFLPDSVIKEIQDER